jgi:hypothetical protein
MQISILQSVSFEKPKIANKKLLFFQLAYLFEVFEQSTADGLLDPVISDCINVICFYEL